MEDGETKRRTFEAEVYSGGRIDNHYYWGRSGVVIDLQGLQLKAKTGLVEEHFGGKRVGVATSYEINQTFRAKGHFLSNAKLKKSCKTSMRNIHSKCHGGLIQNPLKKLHQVKQLK